MGYNEPSSSPSGGGIQAMMFNGLLLVIPLLAAHIVVSAMSFQGFSAVPEPESIAETRQAIDQAFENLPPGNADRESYWADLVDRELRARDLTSARGFLLGGPQMIEVGKARALRAAAEAEVTGGEDERIAHAAVRFLPINVSARYERANRPLSVDGPTAATLEQEKATPIRFSARQQSFSMLGSPSDLADLSERWLRGDSVSTFVLQITGLGLIASEIVESEVNVTLAASILKAAERSGRLHPSYQRLLSQRLDDIFPAETLRAELEANIGGLMSPEEAGDRTLVVFGDVAQTDALPRLEEELQQINRISALTSPSATTFLIEHARHSEDIRKARLVAEAGRERSAALAKELGPRVLGLAQTGLKWTRPLVLQVMGLAGLGALAIWIVVSVFSGAFRRSEPPPVPVVY